MSRAAKHGQVSSMLQRKMVCHQHRSRRTSVRQCMQLDRTASRAATDTKLAELLAAVEETTQVNQFLLQFDSMEIAIASLAHNRESMAHAADALARVFDRIIKANTTIPTAALLEDVLAKSPAGVASWAMISYGLALLHVNCTYAAANWGTASLVSCSPPRLHLQAPC